MNFDALNDLDPRKNSQYSLSAVLTMAFYALLAGETDFVGIAEFCDLRRFTFRRVFGYDKVPSHDTFNRVFKLVDPASMELFFREFAGPLGRFAEQIALDGKAHTNSQSHIVSAFTSNGVCLGSADTGAGKQNELATMIRMVKQLNVKNTIVTTDAMGCNDGLFKEIIRQRGDYVCALKKNQKNAFEDVDLLFRSEIFKFDEDTFTDKHNGKAVTYSISVRSRPTELEALHKFTGLKAIARVVKETQGTAPETRYYLASITDPKQIHECVRNHWHVENKLHWVLDVRFREDQGTVRDKVALKNLNVIRKIAINLMNHFKVGIKRSFMRKICCSEEFILATMRNWRVV